MGSLLRYSVFGRKGKVGKADPDLGCKCSDLAARDLALLRDMEVYKVVEDSVKGETVQGVVPDYAAEASYSEEHAGSERNVNCHEFAAGVVKLSATEDLQKRPYVDGAKSRHETLLWSSCSQGTFQVEAWQSACEGTVISDGPQAVLPQDGGFPHGREDASSASWYGEQSNLSSHAQGFHDGGSTECVCPPLEFAVGKEYSDDGVHQRVTAPKSEEAAECEECLDSSCLLDARECDDEERYSGPASDPGCYAREALKTVPGGVCLDGSRSPLLGANEFTSLQLTVMEKQSFKAGLEKAQAQAPYMSQGTHSDESDSSLCRVKEWVNSIQSPDMDFKLEEDGYIPDGGNLIVESTNIDCGETSAALYPTDFASANNALASTAVRSLHPSSTVAHLSGVGLREVPSLGIFSSLRSLNLSANLIVHVPVGCLPRSLHSLDLSRNRITQMEGFRELTRLRVLNLSHNRITRIGGLANCTLIKELYLVGNKIAEIEGLHRLLKLAVLDVSFNKITTSKALGQLAANYGSLLALNLLGNPILTNFSDDQIRKLVTALAPHVAYLNRQPIKAISVREAALDSVARAALGTSQRHGKSRDVKAGRKAPAITSSSTVKKKPPAHQHSRHLDKKVASTLSSGHRHHGQASGRSHGVGQPSILGEQQNFAFDVRKWPIHRSRSAGILESAGVN